MKHSSRASLSLKFVSGVTLTLYLLTQGVCPPGFSAPAAAFTPTSLQSSLLQIPSEIGHVEQSKTFAGSSENFVLLIQDAHGQEDAQRNTHILLKYLKRNVQPDRLLIEGGFGRLDPERLRFFRDAKMNRKAAEWFLREGDLGGAELFLLEEAGVTANPSAASHMKAHGAEDERLYQRNLESYVRVMAMRDKASDWLERQLKQIETGASRIFTPDLLSFFKTWKSYEDQTLALEHYLNELTKTAVSAAAVQLNDPALQSRWPMLVRYHELKRRESRLNYEETKQDALRLLNWMQQEKIQSVLSKRLESLSGQTPETQGDEGLRSAWEDFYAKAAGKGFDFEHYPALFLWEGARILESELEAPVLQTEMESLRELILSRLIKKEDEGEIITSYRRNLLLRKLFDLQLSRTDLARLEVLKTVIDEPAVHEVYQEAVRFYDGAIAREQPMIERLLQQNDRRVLIAGGFHTEGLVEKLDEAGVSYAVLSPHMSRLDDASRYRASLTSSKPLLSAPSFRSATLRIANLLSEWFILPDAIYSRRSAMVREIYRQGARAGVALAAARSEVRTSPEERQERLFRKRVNEARGLIRNSGLYITQLPAKSKLRNEQILQTGKKLMELDRVIARMKILPSPDETKSGLAGDLGQRTLFLLPLQNGEGPEKDARSLIRAAWILLEAAKISEWNELERDEKKRRIAAWTINADLALTPLKAKNRDFGLYEELVEEQVLNWLDPEGDLFRKLQAEKAEADAQGLAEYQRDLRSGKIQPPLPESMRVYFALLQLDFKQHKDLKRLGQSTTGFELELTDALHQPKLPDEKDPVPELLAGLINAMGALIRKEKVPADEPLQVLMDQEWVHLLAGQVVESLRTYILLQHWQGEDLFKLQRRLSDAVRAIQADLELYSFIRHDFLLKEIEQGLRNAEISVAAAEQLMQGGLSGSSAGQSRLSAAMGNALRLTGQSASTRTPLRIGGQAPLLIAGPESPAVEKDSGSKPVSGETPQESVRVLNLAERPSFPEDAGYHTVSAVLVQNMAKHLDQASTNSPENFIAGYPSDWTANLELAFRRHHSGTIPDLSEIKNVIVLLMHLYSLETKPAGRLTRAVKPVETKWAAAGNRMGGAFAEAEIDRLVTQMQTQARVRKKNALSYTKEQVRMASFLALSLVGYLEKVHARDAQSGSSADQLEAPRVREAYVKALGELQRETGDAFFSYVAGNFQVLQEELRREAQSRPAADSKDSVELDLGVETTAAPAEIKPETRKGRGFWGMSGRGQEAPKEEPASAEKPKKDYPEEPTFEAFIVRALQVGSRVREYAERGTLKQAIKAIKILIGGTEENFKKGYKAIVRVAHPDAQNIETTELNKSVNDLFDMVENDKVEQKNLRAQLDILLESVRKYHASLSKEERQELEGTAKPDSPEAAGILNLAAVKEMIETRIAGLEERLDTTNDLLRQILEALQSGSSGGPAAAAAKSTSKGSAGDEAAKREKIGILFGEMIQIHRGLTLLAERLEELKAQASVYAIAFEMTFTGTDWKEEFESLEKKIPAWLDEFNPEKHEGIEKIPAGQLAAEEEKLQRVLEPARKSLRLLTQHLERLEAAMPLARQIEASQDGETAKSEVRSADMVFTQSSAQDGDIKKKLKQIAKNAFQTGGLARNTSFFTQKKELVIETSWYEDFPPSFVQMGSAGGETVFFLVPDPRRLKTGSTGYRYPLVESQLELFARQTNKGFFPAADSKLTHVRHSITGGKPVNDILTEWSALREKIELSLLAPHQDERTAELRLSAAEAEFGAEPVQRFITAVTEFEDLRFRGENNLRTIREILKEFELGKPFRQKDVYAAAAEMLSLIENSGERAAWQLFQETAQEASVSYEPLSRFFGDLESRFYVMLANRASLWPSSLTQKHYYDVLRVLWVNRFRDSAKKFEEDLEDTQKALSSLDSLIEMAQLRFAALEKENAVFLNILSEAADITAGAVVADAPMAAAGVLVVGSGRRLLIEGAGGYETNGSFSAAYPSSHSKPWVKTNDSAVLLYHSLSGYPNLEVLKAYFRDSTAFAANLPELKAVYLGTVGPEGELRIYRPVSDAAERPYGYPEDSMGLLKREVMEPFDAAVYARIFPKRSHVSRMGKDVKDASDYKNVRLRAQKWMDWIGEIVIERAGPEKGALIHKALQAQFSDKIKQFKRLKLTDPGKPQDRQQQILSLPAAQQRPAMKAYNAAVRVFNSELDIMEGPFRPPVQKAVMAASELLAALVMDELFESIQAEGLSTTASLILEHEVPADEEPQGPVEEDVRKVLEERRKSILNQKKLTNEEVPEFDAFALDWIRNFWSEQGKVPNVPQVRNAWVEHKKAAARVAEAAEQEEKADALAKTGIVDFIWRVVQEHQSEGHSRWQSLGDENQVRAFAAEWISPEMVGAYRASEETARAYPDLSVFVTDMRKALAERSPQAKFTQEVEHFIERAETLDGSDLVLATRLVQEADALLQDTLLVKSQRKRLTEVRKTLFESVASFAVRLLQSAENSLKNGAEINADQVISQSREFGEFLNQYGEEQHAAAVQEALRQFEENSYYHEFLLSLRQIQSFSASDSPETVQSRLILPVEHSQETTQTASLSFWMELLNQERRRIAEGYALAWQTEAEDLPEDDKGLIIPKLIEAKKLFETLGAPVFQEFVTLMDELAAAFQQSIAVKAAEKARSAKQEAQAAKTERAKAFDEMMKTVRRDPETAEALLSAPELADVLTDRLLVEWLQALRDSKDLPKTAKLEGFVKSQLSKQTTYGERRLLFNAVLQMIQAKSEVRAGQPGAAMARSETRDRKKVSEERRRQRRQERDEIDAAKRSFLLLTIAASMGGGLLVDFLFGMSPLDPEVPLEKFFVVYFLTAAGIATAMIVAVSLPYWFLSIKEWMAARQKAALQKKQAAERKKAQDARRQDEPSEPPVTQKQSSVPAEEITEPVDVSPQPQMEQPPVPEPTSLEKALTALRSSFPGKIKRYATSAKRKASSRTAEAVLREFEEALIAHQLELTEEFELSGQDAEAFENAVSEMAQGVRPEIQQKIADLKTAEMEVYTRKRSFQMTKLQAAFQKAGEEAKRLADELMAEDPDRDYPFHNAYESFDQSTARAVEAQENTLSFLPEDQRAREDLRLAVRAELQNSLESDYQIVFEAREAVRLEREAAEQAVRDFENARLAMVDYFWDRIVTKGHAAKFGEEAEVRDFTSSWITDEQVRAYQENTNNLPRFIDLQRAWEAHVRSQDPKYLLAQEFNEVAGQFGKTAPQSMAELAVLIVEAGRFVEAHPELESSQTGRLKKNILDLLESHLNRLRLNLNTEISGDEAVSEAWYSEFNAFKGLRHQEALEAFLALNNFEKRITGLEEKAAQHDLNALTFVELRQMLEAVSTVSVSDDNAVADALEQSRILLEQTESSLPLARQLAEARTALFDRWAQDAGHSLEAFIANLGETSAVEDNPVLTRARAIADYEEFASHAQLLQETLERFQDEAGWLDLYHRLRAAPDEITANDLDRITELLDESENYLEGPASAKIKEARENLARVFSERLAETVLEVEEGRESALADIIHSRVAAMARFFQADNPELMKEAMDAERLLREQAAVHQRKIEAERRASQADKQTLIKQWVDHPQPLKEAAAFFLAEPEFQSFLDKNRIVRQFLEKAAAGEKVPSNTDKLRTYLGVDAAGTKVNVKSPSNQVAGPDRRIIDALTNMVKNLRSEVRALPENWEALQSPDLFDDLTRDILEWRLSAIQALWPSTGQSTREMLLTPSFLLMMLGIKPAYFQSGPSEPLPAKFFSTVTPYFHNDMGYALWKNHPSSPAAFSVYEASLALVESLQVLGTYELSLDDEDTRKLELIAAVPYSNWMLSYDIFIKEILNELFARAVKQDAPMDVFMGILSGYPVQDVEAYVRLDGRRLAQQGRLHEAMKHLTSEFSGISFWMRPEGSPEAHRQLARFRAALYYAYAGLRDLDGFAENARSIGLPETVFETPTPQSLARAEVRSLQVQFIREDSLEQLLKAGFTRTLLRELYETQSPDLRRHITTLAGYDARELSRRLTGADDWNKHFDGLLKEKKFAQAGLLVMKAVLAEAYTGTFSVAAEKRSELNQAIQERMKEMEHLSPSNLDENTVRVREWVRGLIRGAPDDPAFGQIEGRVKTDGAGRLSVFFVRPNGVKGKIVFDTGIREEKTIEFRAVYDRGRMLYTFELFPLTDDASFEPRAYVLRRHADLSVQWAQNPVMLDTEPLLVGWGENWNEAAQNIDEQMGREDTREPGLPDFETVYRTNSSGFVTYKKDLPVLFRLEFTPQTLFAMSRIYSASLQDYLYSFIELTPAGRIALVDGRPNLRTYRLERRSNRITPVEVDPLHIQSPQAVEPSVKAIELRLKEQFESAQPDAPSFQGFEKLYFRTNKSGDKNFSAAGKRILFSTGQPDQLFELRRFYDQTLREWIYEVLAVTRTGKPAKAGPHLYYRPRRDGDGRLVQSGTALQVFDYATALQEAANRGVLPLHQAGVSILEHYRLNDRQKPLDAVQWTGLETDPEGNLNIPLPSAERYAQPLFLQLKAGQAGEVSLRRYYHPYAGENVYEIYSSADEPERLAVFRMNPNQQAPLSEILIRFKLTRIEKNKMLAAALKASAARKPGYSEEAYEASLRLPPSNPAIADGTEDFGVVQQFLVEIESSDFSAEEYSGLVTAFRRALQIIENGGDLSGEIAALSSDLNLSASDALRSMIQRSEGSQESRRHLKEMIQEALTALRIQQAAQSEVRSDKSEPQLAELQTVIRELGLESEVEAGGDAQTGFVLSPAHDNPASGIDQKLLNAASVFTARYEGFETTVTDNRRTGDRDDIYVTIKQPSRAHRSEVRSLDDVKSTLAREVPEVYRSEFDRPQTAGFGGKPLSADEITEVVSTINRYVDDLAEVLGEEIFIELAESNPQGLLKFLDIFYQNGLTLAVLPDDALQIDLLVYLRKKILDPVSLVDLMRQDLGAAERFLFEAKNYPLNDLKAGYPGLIHTEMPGLKTTEQKLTEFAARLRTDFEALTARPEAVPERVTLPDAFRDAAVLEAGVARLLTQDARELNLDNLIEDYQRLFEDGKAWLFFAALEKAAALEAAGTDPSFFWVIEDFQHTIYWRIALFEFLTQRTAQLELSLGDIARIGHQHILQVETLFARSHDDEGFPILLRPHSGRTDVHPDGRILLTAEPQSEINLGRLSTRTGYKVLIERLFAYIDEPDRAQTALNWLRYLASEDVIDLNEWQAGREIRFSFDKEAYVLDVDEELLKLTEPVFRALAAGKQDLNKVTAFVAAMFESADNFTGVFQSRGDARISTIKRVTTHARQRELIPREARSEVRHAAQDETILAVAEKVTARIVRISDLRPEILNRLFPAVEPEAALPAQERQWISAFYAALFRQGSSIVMPAVLLQEASVEAQRDYLQLLLEALQASGIESDRPLIHIASDAGDLKNLFYSSELWRHNPSLSRDAGRAVKFWTQSESEVARRLSHEKIRYAAAVTSPSAVKERAFLVNPEEIRKLSPVQRKIFQARLTQLLLAASALNEEEFVQLARELGIAYQAGQAMAIGPSTILSSLFVERMNALAISASA